ncbi:predicted protein [Clavispora lusitaniae ATCC 42720]|uniref:Uncharacterized protein n=1 Tax=Clavispora lusitaniae (strain ATCC 42720) TaxID=306902 RepID=C4YAN5_CLAL4|nr:uncharacterized protein CLUG_05263 [Clavispora lusitaniae ATCC 42720]EEQ41136.1 predicted protein [Clavispora lusitaniae ATCC 42720]
MKREKVDGNRLSARTTKMRNQTLFRTRGQRRRFIIRTVDTMKESNTSKAGRMKRASTTKQMSTVNSMCSITLSSINCKTKKWKRILRSEKMSTASFQNNRKKGKGAGPAKRKQRRRRKLRPDAPEELWRTQRSGKYMPRNLYYIRWAPNHYASSD